MSGIFEIRDSGFMDTSAQRHHDNAPDTDDAANPVLAEVTRGDTVESRHRGAFAVVDAAGRVALSAGDVERAIYARSAIKPIQALALIETGAAAAFALSDREIALACASHNGEPCHVDALRAWLGRLGLGEPDLVCGAAQTDDAPAQDRPLDRSRRGPLHDNCSGKHAGFLTVAKHLGHPTAGYHRFDHPVQQRVQGVLEQMSGLDLGAAPRGIDGCGIPAIAMPLGNIALAMARLADPADQPDTRQDACARVRAAMAAEPYMVAGADRFCTRVMAITREAALIKTGAEGVYCGALPGLGLGIAVKVDDGARRAAELVMGALLCRLGILDETNGAPIADALEPAVKSRAGETVGTLRPGPGLAGG